MIFASRRSNPGAFDRWDIFVGVLAAGLSFCVYFLTTAPSVTLLDSGEFITAGQQFGVPHPTGYPLWTMLAWLFHLLPLGNAAWEINLLSGVLGALAVGIAASLCRSSICWLFPGESHRPFGLASVSALSSSLLFAFSLSMWSQAVITEIYTLHALLVVCMLVALYAWMRRPHHLGLLLTVFFFLSLAFSNHQLTIALAPLPFLAVFFVRRRMFWDLVVAALLTAELCYLALAVLSHDTLVLKTSIRVFYCLFIFTVLYVRMKRNRVRWRLIALLPFAVALGLLPYAYMPFASSTNPPMNWGYAREASGFFYSFNRSQYSGSLTSQSLRALGPLVGVSTAKASPPPAPALLTPAADTSLLHQAGEWPLFFCLKLLKSFTPLAAIAFSAALAALFFVPDTRRRIWLVILFAAFALAAFLQPLLDKATCDSNGWWLQMPYHTYTNLLFGLLCGTGFFFVFHVLFRRFPALFPIQYALLLLPLAPLLVNYDQAGQRNRWFGWQYGYDMLKDLPKGSIVIGGTDAGRFVSTYMIFGESPQPSTRKRDPDFDRRDLYIMTQNALGEPFYMSYLQDQYGSRRPPPKNRFEHWLGRETIYPKEPLFFPSAADMQRAFSAASVPDPATGKRLEAVDSIRPFSSVLHWIWNQNRGEHAFFIEESFPIEWTYDYAIPHGLVYQLNKTKLDRLPDDAVARDFAFWADYKKRLLENPAFRSDFDAQRSFSKLRFTGGNIYRHWKMSPEAEKAYREALELWPGASDALYALMQLQWERGEFDESLKLIEQALREDPRNSSLQQLEKHARLRKEVQGEIRRLESALVENPADRGAHEQLILLYTQASQPDKAGEHLSKGLETLGKDPDFLRFVINHYQMHQQAEKSLEPARKLVGIEPDFGPNYYLLARACYSQSDLPGFYKAVEKAISLGGLQTRAMILQDSSFTPLHQEAAFQKLMELPMWKSQPASPNPSPSL